jgi:hypothetical protein
MGAVGDSHLHVLPEAHAARVVGRLGGIVQPLRGERSARQRRHEGLES